MFLRSETETKTERERERETERESFKLAKNNRTVGWCCCWLLVDVEKLISKKHTQENQQQFCNNNSGNTPHLASYKFYDTFADG